MIIDTFDTEKRVLIIAEIGNNHEGSFDVAVKMIEAAAKAGADAVKFQTFHTEYYVSRNDTARFARLKSFELTEEQWKKLHARATQLGLLFISTPFDLVSARFLDGIVSAFKIASGDNLFYPLLATVATTGKPLLISSGMVTIKELHTIQSFLQNILRTHRIAQECAFLHCVASYPVPPNEANLRAIQTMQEALGGTIGYSDHTMGIDAAIAAAAMGARIIEKHFTLDTQYSDFRDHELSLDPKGFTTLVQRIRMVEVLRGSGVKESQQCERSSLQSLRRSIVATRSIAIDETIGPRDMTWVRPAGGLPPGSERQLIGKVAIRPIAEGEMFSLDALRDAGGDV